MSWEDRNAWDSYSFLRTDVIRHSDVYALVDSLAKFCGVDVAEGIAEYPGLGLVLDADPFCPQNSSRFS
jgi:hypothetical protein